MLSLEEKCEIIKNTEIFSSVSDEHRSMIAQRMGEKSFPQGSFFFREEDPGDSMMIICKGEVEIIKGESTVLAVLEEGDILGEMAALSGNARSTSARAKSDAIVLFLKGDALRLLICKIPEISMSLMRVLIDRLQTANKVIQSLGEKKNKKDEGPKFILSIPQQGETVVLPEVLTLGRGNPAEKYPGRLNLKSAEKSYISQKHAQIFMHRGNYFIRDMGSSNGTRLNGTRIQEIVSLSPGDKIEIGELTMTFQKA